MKLTAFTDYSLRVLIYLAAQPGRRATVGEISRAFGISEHHLVKVVHFLGKRGWISTLRGKGGGLMLARPAAQIAVGEVVRAAEGPAGPAECHHADGACVISAVCGLKPALDEAMRAFYAVLDRTAVADVAGQQPALIRVLRAAPAESAAAPAA